MKNFLIFSLTLFAFITVSCSTDDGASTTNSQAQEAEFQATIDGDTYSSYSFEMRVYEAKKGTNGNTLSIDVADINGEMITLFLNGTGGFSNSTVKEMGDIDSENFTNYVLIRQSGTQISYFSSTGRVTILKNREHPTEAGHRLISGHFDITASSIDGTNTTSMTGSFTELDYVE